MMNWIWALLALVGIGFTFSVSGRGDAGATLMQAAMDAVLLCIRLAGGFAFWSGIIAILEDSGAVKALVRALKRPLGWLFPGVDMGGEAGQAISLNLAANMLGLGNAATPMGIQAMRHLGEQVQDGVATDAICMFLVINATSIQLFPGSVIALRAAAGSASPANIVLPTLVATAVSTVVGIVICRLLARGTAHA